MPEKPVLYSYYRSSCSWRVRIALQWKEVDYAHKKVNLILNGGEQNTPTYKEMNGMAQVPTLVLANNMQLTQSMAILEYLEEAYPHKNLLPKDIEKRFKVREICEIIVSGIQPLQNLSVLKHFQGEEQKLWAKKWIEKGLIALENVLEGSSGKYCVGDEVTLADCCLVPQLYNARRFEVELEPFGITLRVEKELEKLEPFVKAHPCQQPDFPQESV